MNEDKAVINALVTAGFVNKHITKHNKEVACEKLIMHYSLMSRKLELDDIRRGMDIVQLVSFLKNQKDLWMEVFPRVNDIKFEADMLVKKLTLCPGEGDLDESKEKSFQWCKDYVASLPGKTFSYIHV